MTLKRLAAVRVFVAELSKAVRFYESTLGLSLAGQASESAVFKLENADLIIERANPADPEGAEMIGRFTALSLETEDCQSLVGALTAKGVQFLGPVQTQAWGGKLAHFLDPDGNVLTLVEYPKSV